jgi:signal transduction histidine kinase
MISVAIVAIGGLLIVSSNNLTETRDLNLSHNTTAIQQNVSQRLSGTSDYLHLLAVERANGGLTATSFQRVASRFVKDHPELHNITWVDSESVITDVAPLDGNRMILGLQLSLPEPARASRLARETRAPVYTKAFEAIQGDPSFEVWVPVFSADEFLGLFAGVYSCEKLLQATVPSGVSTANRIEMYNAAGAVMADLAPETTTASETSQTREIATTNNGLSIKVTHYASSFWSQQPSYLLVACLILAAGLVAGLLKLRHEHAGRLKTEEALQRRENELAHMNRLSSMGELVAEIAHEINQPLHSISNFASACEKALKSPTDGNVDKVRNWNQRIADSAIRAGNIIQRLRAYTRKNEDARSELNLNEVVRESIELLSSRIVGARVSIRTDLADSLPKIHADRIQLQQVIVNLMNNAIDAVEKRNDKSGQLTIRTFEQNQSAEFAVEDNGVGLSPETIAHAFEPFFTTKSHGMGLGLAISRTIIEHHEGTIWATSNDDSGTTFHFALPQRKSA